MSATAWCEVDQVRDLDFGQWLFGSWGLALAFGLLLHLAGRRTGRSAWASAGFAVMTVPAWMVVLEVLPDLARTFCEKGDVVAVVNLHPQVPAPYTHRQLSDRIIFALLTNLSYIALGAFLVAQGRDPGWWQAPRLQRVAFSLRGLLPMGGGEMASLRSGVAWFPALALGNLALLAITGTPIQSAGKGPLYALVTPYHSFFLALAAGFGEELLFRGVMQQGLLFGLKKIAPRAPSLVAASVVIPLVAVLFAYSHAGYGNPSLLIFAFLFSILASVAALWLGIWAAIALHALIDFAAFVVSVPDPGLDLLATMTVVGAAVVAISGREAWRGIQWLGWRRSGT